MNFFEHQAKARRNTKWLVFMFILAVASIVIAIDLLAFVVFGLGATAENGVVDPSAAFTVNNLTAAWPLLTGTSAVVLLVIGGASLFRIVQLGGGGGKVAQSLGGRLVPTDTHEFKERRLRNVVEEVALASGVPVPQIYVLPNEPGINAFAAGFSTGDAAIAVSAGALEHLTRDELQGVVAHEFSHILNGDMRLNVRLMGVLFGILLLGIIGRHLLRGARYSGRSKNGGAIIAVGLGVMVIGYIGVFFGNLIKAAVSRQREYLADSSAVQFTRDPQGIAGALKKIGALKDGSHIADPNAEEVSHMLFAAGFSQLFATHPPLIERIRAIEPGFDPRELNDVARRLHAGAQPDETTEREEGERRERMLGAAVIAAQATDVLGSIGNPGWSHIELARELRQGLPAPLLEALQKPTAAMTVVCGLVVAEEFDIAERQLQLIKSRLGEEAAQRVPQVTRFAAGVSPALRLPIVELAAPAIKADPRHSMFGELLDELIHLDDKVDVFEYAVARLVRQDLERFDQPRQLRPPIRKLSRVRDEIVTLFAIMAAHGHDDETSARRAFNVGLDGLFPQAPIDYAPPTAWVDAMDAALDRLLRLQPLLKEDLINQLVKTVLADGTARLSEIELLRAVCGALECPLPPILKNTPA